MVKRCGRRCLVDWCSRHVGVAIFHFAAQRRTAEALVHQSDSSASTGGYQADGCRPTSNRAVDGNDMDWCGLIMTGYSSEYYDPPDSLLKFCARGRLTLVEADVRFIELLAALAFY